MDNKRKVDCLSYFKESGRKNIVSLNTSMELNQPGHGLRNEGINIPYKYPGILIPRRGLRASSVRVRSLLKRERTPDLSCSVPVIPCLHYALRSFLLPIGER